MTPCTYFATCLTVLPLIVACTQSTMPGSDAGLDGFVDVPSLDGGIDGLVMVDAGETQPDAAPSPLRCSIGEEGPTLGSACFCQGPLVVRDGFLYRQSLGLEVHDVSDPDAPRLLRTIEERPSANGSVIVVGDWLITDIDFADEPIHLYSLARPEEPLLVQQFGDSLVSAIAGAGNVLAAVSEGEAPFLQVYSLGETRAEPTWRVDLTAAGPVAVNESAVFVANVPRFGGGGALIMYTHEGEEVDRRPITSRSETALAVQGQSLFLTGATPALVRFDVRRRLEEAASWGDPEDRARGQISFAGDVAVLPNPLRVFDPSTLEPLDEGDTRTASNVAYEAGTLYLSNGNGVRAASLGCD